MKFCTHCGKELMDEAVVCTNCGCAVNGAKMAELLDNGPQTDYDKDAESDNDMRRGYAAAQKEHTDEQG